MSEQESYDLADVDTPTATHSMPIFDDESSSRKPRNHPASLRTDIKSWTRFEESGPAIFRVAAAGMGTLVLAWLFAGWQTLHIAGWICVLGAILTTAMAYPLVVGLERPIRMSPERVVRDYFEALEHHGPLLRRMWIFLAPEGRQGRYFANLDQFQFYWKRRIREWRHRGDGLPMTPVSISIENFQQTFDPEIDNLRHLKFTVAVSLRGKRDKGPVSTYQVEWSAVKASDRQWYLLNGDLPE